MPEDSTNFWINVNESRSSSAFEKSLESLNEFGDMTSIGGGSSHARDRENDPIRGDLDKASAYTQKCN
jgi:hypothetical protein